VCVAALSGSGPSAVAVEQESVDALGIVVEFVGETFACEWFAAAGQAAVEIVGLEFAVGQSGALTFELEAENAGSAEEMHLEAREVSAGVDPVAEVSVGFDLDAG